MRKLYARKFAQEWKLIGIKLDASFMWLKNILWTHQQRLNDIWKSFAYFTPEEIESILEKVNIHYQDPLYPIHVEKWIQEICRCELALISEKLNEIIGEDMIVPVSKGEGFQGTDQEYYQLNCICQMLFPEKYTEIQNSELTIESNESKNKNECNHVESEKKEEKKILSKEEKIQAMFDKDYQKLYKNLDKAYPRNKLFEAAESIGLFLSEEMKKPEMLHHMIRFALSKNLIVF